MFHGLIQIDKSAQESLQGQIRRQIAIAIADGKLPIDQRLPSIRALADELQVSLNTVALAYATLRDDGFLVSQDRSGFLVNPEARTRLREGRTVSEQPDTQPRFDFKSHFAGRSYNLPRTMKPSDCLVRYRYPFVCGLVDPTLFPISMWRECVRDSGSAVELQNWAADFSSVDDKMLIDQLIKRLLAKRGIFAGPDEVLITVGGQQALYLALKLLMKPGQTVGVEDPGYPEMINIAAMERMRIQRLPVDQDGLVPSGRIEDCQSLYITSSHQFPTTATLSMERRQALLDNAVRTGKFIIEDDYEAETSFCERPLPAIKSMDRTGNVIYVGSLSKSLMPGLRIGFLIGDRDFITEARALRHHVLRHPPVNNQRTVALFLQRGYFDRFLGRLRSAYKARHEAMSAALRKHLPAARAMSSYGSNSYWVALPDSVDAVRLLRQVEPQGVYFEPGSAMFAQPEDNRNFIRLGFSAIDESLIDAGIAIIARQLGLANQGADEGRP
ncbi:MAG: PLP-dependent aminotransferase family protein [Mesorhizobium sp.]